MEVEINDTIDLATIKKTFLDEIDEVISSETFLAGRQSNEEIVFVGSRTTMPCEICNLQILAEDIEIQGDDPRSKAFSLNRWRCDINSTLIGVNSYIAIPFSRELASIEEEHGKLIWENRNLDRISSHLAQCLPTPLSSSKTTIMHFLHLMIAKHFEGIVAARVLTVSRRVYLLEAVFEAYRLGLLPFGWNHKNDSLYCVNPLE
ncbi:MAG: hypothetical protein CMJ46_04400 [Planctomyces sp.]|nr:hypothetical protein [Planctomyces sp.]